MKSRHVSKQQKKQHAISESLSITELYRDSLVQNNILTTNWFNKDGEQSIDNNTVLLESNESQTGIIIRIDWNSLPESLNPSKGELNEIRATRKKDQVEYLVHLIERELNILRQQQLSSHDCSDSNQCLTVVEIGAGSGHLCLLLAYRNQDIRFILAERKEYCIDVACRRIEECQLQNIIIFSDDLLHFETFLANGNSNQSFSITGTTNNNSTLASLQDNTTSSTTQILIPTPNNNNLNSYNSNSSSHYTISMVLGLHCCGLLTDLSLETSLKHNASFVIVPCCYGQVSKPPPSATKSLDVIVSVDKSISSSSSSYLNSIDSINDIDSMIDSRTMNVIDNGNITTTIIDTANNKDIDTASATATSSQQYRSQSLFHQYPTCLPSLSSGADFVYTFENITDDVILKQPTFLLAKRCMNIVDFDRLLHVCEKSENRYICKIDSIRPLSSSPKNNIIIGRYIQPPVLLPYDTTIELTTATTTPVTF